MNPSFRQCGKTALTYDQFKKELTKGDEDMKSFEEDFPSLKGLPGCHASNECVRGECDCNNVDIEHIQKFCIDKQRLKEVLDECDRTFDFSKPTTDMIRVKLKLEE